MTDTTVKMLMDTHNAMIEAGREYERERIIELLENDICPDWTLWCCDGWCGAYIGAIKLIKGEK